MKIKCTYNILCLICTGFCSTNSSVNYTYGCTWYSSLLGWGATLCWLWYFYLYIFAYLHCFSLVVETLKHTLIYDGVNIIHQSYTGFVSTRTTTWEDG